VVADALSRIHAISTHVIDYATLALEQAIDPELEALKKDGSALTLEPTNIPGSAERVISGLSTGKAPQPESPWPTSISTPAVQSLRVARF